MAKINLKNSIRNPLVEFLKNRRLVFSSMGRSKDSTQITEKIKVFATNPSDVSEILAIANNYGIHLYHDTTVENNMIMNKTIFEEVLKYLKEKEDLKICNKEIGI